MVIVVLVVVNVVIVMVIVMVIVVIVTVVGCDWKTEISTARWKLYTCLLIAAKHQNINCLPLLIDCLLNVYKGH